MHYMNICLNANYKLIQILKRDHKTKEVTVVKEDYVSIHDDEYFAVLHNQYSRILDGFYKDAGKGAKQYIRPVTKKGKYSD